MPDETPPIKPRTAVRKSLIVLALIVIPASFALNSVDMMRPMVELDPNASPLGYTKSLLFFVVPVIVLGIWYNGWADSRHERRCFWLSWLFLFLLGVLLDTVFGEWFFTFPNENATIRFPIPVRGGEVPVEEFGFYSFGFAAILLTYIWSNEYWLGEYKKHAVRSGRRPDWGDLVRVHWTTVLLTVAVVAAAIGFKYWESDGTGFPGYFLFLLATGVLPNVLFFHAVKRHINWRALLFTAMLMLPVSLLWEGVLGVPYQWWGYKYEQMLGIRIHALSDLPIEEPLLWMVVSYAGVTIYEVFRLKFGAERDDVTVRAH